MEDKTNPPSTNNKSTNSTGRRGGRQRNINLKQQQDLTDSAMEILLNPTLISPTRLSSSTGASSTSPLHPSPAIKTASNHKTMVADDDNSNHPLPLLEEEDQQQLIDASANEEDEQPSATRSTTMASTFAPVASPLISPNASKNRHQMHINKNNNNSDNDDGSPSSHRLLDFAADADQAETTMDFVVDEEDNGFKMKISESDSQGDTFNLMGANSNPSLRSLPSPEPSPPAPSQQEETAATKATSNGNQAVAATSNTGKSKSKKKSSTKKESSVPLATDTFVVAGQSNPVAIMSEGAMDEVEIRDNFWGIPVANKPASNLPSSTKQVDDSMDGGDLMTFVVEDQPAVKKKNSTSSSSSSSSRIVDKQPQPTLQKKKKKQNTIVDATSTTASTPQSAPPVSSSSNTKGEKRKSTDQEQDVGGQAARRVEETKSNRVKEEAPLKTTTSANARSSQDDIEQQTSSRSSLNAVKSSSTAGYHPRKVTGTAANTDSSNRQGQEQPSFVVVAATNDSKQQQDSNQQKNRLMMTKEEDQKQMTETEKEKQRLRRVEREWAFKHNLPTDLSNLVLTVREFKAFGGTNLALLDSGGHIRFKITRSLLDDSDDLTPQHVFRRFRDFQALFLRLAHLFPFEIVPALPSTLFPSFSDDFLQIRSRRLEAFLYTLLRRNKQFWQCEDVQNFLLKESEVFDEMAVRYLGNNGQDLSVPPSLVSEKFFSFVKKIASSTTNATSSSSSTSNASGQDAKRKYDEQRGEISASYEALSVFIDGQGAKQERLDCWETVIDKLEQINSLAQSRMEVLTKMKSTLSEIFPEEPNIAEAFDPLQDDQFAIQLTGADKSPSIGSKSMQGCLRSAHQSATLLGGVKETMARIMLEENFLKLGEHGQKELVDKFAKLKRETSQLSLEMARDFAQASLIKAESTRKSMEALKASLESLY